MTGKRTRDIRVSEIHHLVVRSILQYVDDHIGGDLRVGTLAARAGYEYHYFTKFFTVIVGVPPGRYVTRRRIEHAKHLFETRLDMSVEQVAHAVGYQLVSSLAYLFEQYVGCRPAVYRNRVRRQLAAELAASAQLEAQPI